jgi:hypothetical protein
MMDAVSVRYAVRTPLVGWTPAYHFLRADMTAGRGAEAPWRIGEERTLAGALRPGVFGYHSAVRWYDALRYAPGPVACVVDVSAPEVLYDCMQVSRTRRLLACAGAGREVRLWACACAERALRRAASLGVDVHLASWEAVAVGRAFADGAATLADLQGARAAAEAAVRAPGTRAREAALAWVAAYAALDENDTHRRFALPCRQAAYTAAELVPAGRNRDLEVAWQQRLLAELLDSRVGAMVQEGGAVG